MEVPGQGQSVARDCKQKVGGRKIKLEKEKKLAEQKRLLERDPKEIFQDEDYKKHSIGQYDENGIPSHNNKGEPFSAKVVEKFKKDFEKQVKARDEWLKKQEKAV
jgi:hypothetical protein